MNVPRSQLLVEQSRSVAQLVLQADRSVMQAYRPQLVSAPATHEPAPSHAEAATCWFITGSQLPGAQTEPTAAGFAVQVPSNVATPHERHGPQLEVPQQKPSTHWLFAQSSFCVHAAPTPSSGFGRHAPPAQ